MVHTSPRKNQVADQAVVYMEIATYSPKKAADRAAVQTETADQLAEKIGPDETAWRAARHNYPSGVLAADHSRLSEGSAGHRTRLFEGSEEGPMKSLAGSAAALPREMKVVLAQKEAGLVGDGGDVDRGRNYQTAVDHKVHLAVVGLMGTHNRHRWAVLHQSEAGRRESMQDCNHCLPLGRPSESL